MMKITFVLAFHFICSSVHAQVTFLKNDNLNGMTFDMCKTNHNRIFSAYKKQTDSQISRLLTGLDEEISRKTSNFKLEGHYSLLSKLIMERILIEELTKQLNAFDWKNYQSSDRKIYNQKLFKLEKVKINLDQKVVENLKKAGDFEYQFDKNMLEIFSVKIATNLATNLAESAYISIGSGIATQISANALKSATISFGANVFKGALQGTLLSLITMPLRASRLPPESIWLDLLEENPELVINPDWLRDAGGSDHPWKTHCVTIHRKTDRMVKVVKDFLKKDEKDFTTQAAHINEFLSTQSPKDFKQEKYQSDTKAEIDNTYVKKPLSVREVDIPFWAQK